MAIKTLVGENNLTSSEQAVIQKKRIHVKDSRLKGSKSKWMDKVDKDIISKLPNEFRAAESDVSRKSIDYQDSYCGLFANE